MKKSVCLILTVLLTLLPLASCGKQTPAGDNGGKKTYKIGLCNYVDDASLNQIAAHIQSRLQTLADENGVVFDIRYDNCNGDSNVLAQIIANFQADQVDVMVGIATPVAMAMQSAAEGTDLPVVFSAVSDPISTGLAESWERSGSNLTGTSDYLNTQAIMDLILALIPDIQKVGLLYDVGQDSSSVPVAEAKSFFAEKGVEVVEHTGTNVSEITLAAEALISDGVEAVFTPTDNTVMLAELSIYEAFAGAGIPHFAGANSFALNGAFLGYGVDYEALGDATADVIAEILLEGKDPAEMPVVTFDNGTATVNTEICEALSYDFETVKDLFTPFCTRIETISTAEDF